MKKVPEIIEGGILSIDMGQLSDGKVEAFEPVDALIGAIKWGAR